MDDRLERLLQGPRGRRVCWELDVNAAPGDGSDATAVLDALRRSVDTSMCWEEPDETDRMLAGGNARARLTPIARTLLGSETTEGWDDPLALDDQHYTDLLLDDGDEPVPLRTGTSELAVWRAEEEQANAQLARLRVERPNEYVIVSAAWWSTPATNDTTRGRGAAGPIGLDLVEDSLGWKRAVSWPVSVNGPVRIYEITGPDAWAELVRRYPFDATESRQPNWSAATGRSGHWLLPDWPAVAADYDAVHVSVLGYLATAGRAVPVDENAAAVMAGWAPDEAYWLADVLQVTGPATAWVRGDDGEWSAAG